VIPFDPYDGVWWLPESPETKIPGTLHFDGKTPVLSLIGSVRPLAGGPEGWSLQPRLVLGSVVDQEGNEDEVTLCRCSHLKSYGSLEPGLSRASYTAIYIIFGAHFTTDDELRFERFWVRYDRLLEWTQLTGFTFNPDDEEPARGTIAVKWRLPEAHAAAFCGWQTKFIYGWRQTGDRVEHLNLQQELSVEVVPQGPTTLDDFLIRFSDHFANFVSLGIGSAVYPISLKAQTSATVMGVAEPQGVKVYFLVKQGSAESGKIRRALEAELTQVEVAKALRRTQAYVSKCELGERRIDPLDLFDFARLYRKPMSYFVPDSR
jgi:hypothetical protein